MKVILFIIAVCFTSAVSAQSFFKPLPKRAASGPGIRATGDVTTWALRPVASAVTLYIDGNVQAAAGGGVSYQNITQRAADGRAYVNYAFNLIAAAGGAVSNDAPRSDITKFALYISALNNTVGLGYGMSRQQDPITLNKKWKGGLAVVWTYNFNN